MYQPPPPHEGTCSERNLFCLLAGIVTTIYCTIIILHWNQDTTAAEAILLTQIVTSIVRTIAYQTLMTLSHYVPVQIIENI